MPFYISYTLLNHKGTWSATTAAKAVATFNLLETAGIGGLSVRDEKGTIYTPDQLQRLAAATVKRGGGPGLYA